MVRVLLFTILAKSETLFHTFRAKRQVTRFAKKKLPKVSVIIVVYNGLEYLRTCIASLKQTAYPNKEIIVVDNNSDEPTQAYLDSLEKKHVIDKLRRLKENVFFCAGNNRGVDLVDKDSNYVLLLNSDTKALSRDWLHKLVAHAPKKGMISFGKAALPFRPDGWCLLIATSAYKKLRGIDEKFKMNWGITDLTARALRKRVPVRIIPNAQKHIIHYGGKSYTTETKKAQDTNKLPFFSLLKSAPWLHVETIALN